MTRPHLESWICPIWRPRREPSLARTKNQKYMTCATSGPNLVIMERFEQLYDYRLVELKMVIA